MVCEITDPKFQVHDFYIISAQFSLLPSHKTKKQKPVQNPF